MREKHWFILVGVVLGIALVFALLPQTRAIIYQSKLLQIIGSAVLSIISGICIWRGAVHLAIVEASQKDRLKGQDNLKNL